MALFQQSVLKKHLNDLNKEHLQKAWAIFRSHFHDAVKQQNIYNAKEEQYQEGFLRELFVDVLGYTLNPTPNFNLTTEYKNEKDSKKADGAILLPSGADDALKVTAVIELKGTDTTDLGKVETQAFSYKNNQKGCTYVITSNFEKLRFYINDATEHIEFNLFTLTEKEFATLYVCLHSTQLLQDVPLRMKQASVTEEENITKKLYADYSTFKRQLFQNIAEQNPQHNKLELFKKTQKLLDRLLFILFAEDRLLVPPNSVREILKQWEQLKDLDNYVPLYERFKKYFGYLNTGYEGKQYEIFAYNGGLFAADELLDTIVIDDKLLYEGCKRLSDYDFESEVDVNILGHIFEHSLNEIEEVEQQLSKAVLPTQEGTAGPDSKPKTSKRKKDGVFYTPRYITKYIVENTVGTLCTQQKETLGIVDDEFTPQKRKDNTKKLQQKLDDYRSWLLQLTICDPACGSGAFLNQALEFLIQEHRYVDELKARLFGDAFVLSNVETEILQNNLFGVDINEEAVEIARLSLWLRTAKKGRKLNNLSNNIKCGNSLINDPFVAGDKAFDWQQEFPQVFAKGGFDVVIGNPPYVLCQPSNTENDVLEYFKSYKVASYKIDLFHLFFEKSINLLASNGQLGFITPNTYLTNKYIKTLREFILNTTTVVSVLQCEQGVFYDASVDVAIITLVKSLNLESTAKVGKITTKGLIEIAGLINTNSWLNDKDFVFNLNDNGKISYKNTVKLGEIANTYFGIQAYDRNSSISKTIENESFLPIIDGEDIHPLSIAKATKYFDYKPEKIKSGGDWKVYSQERVVVRQIGKLPIVGFCTSNILASNTLYSIYPKSDIYDLFFILGVLNSSLIKYFWTNTYSDNKDLFPKIKGYQLQSIPIKIANIDVQRQIGNTVKSVLELNNKKDKVVSQLSAFIYTKFDSLQSNKRIQNWYNYSFIELLAELAKQKIKLGLSEEAEWLTYFDQQKAIVSEIQQAVKAINKEIDRMIYELYELTEEEIKIVEGN